MPLEKTLSQSQWIIVFLQHARGVMFGGGNETRSTNGIVCRPRFMKVDKEKNLDTRMKKI